MTLEAKFRRRRRLRLLCRGVWMLWIVNLFFVVAAGNGIDWEVRLGAGIVFAQWGEVPENTWVRGLGRVVYGPYAEGVEVQYSHPSVYDLVTLPVTLPICPEWHCLVKPVWNLGIPLWPIPALLLCWTCF